ncbi:sugar ABC transporter permease [bacterium]|nr:MAG: sugar ABC transporter permease [bacterium]
MSPSLSQSPPQPPEGRSSSNRSANLAFWTFVSPALIGLTIFTLIPIIWGLILSFSQAQNTIRPVKFVGVANYLDLLTDAMFLRSLGVIVIFAAFIVPLTYCVSLGLALLINKAGRGKAFFRTVFFIPSAVSYVIASLIWKVSMFSGTESGFANNLIGFFGKDAISWISPLPGQGPTYWLVLVSARLWLQVGFYMIIFLAALQEIPPSIYEAASVDGAKPGWQTLRYITLPQLRATTISVLILNFIAAFQAFDEFYNILAGAGGAYLAARPPLVYLYSIALTDQDFGRGTAGAFIVTALILAVTAIQSRVLGFGDKD